MPKLIPETERTIALCYLRKSIVRSGTNYASIELQRAGAVNMSSTPFIITARLPLKI